MGNPIMWYESALIWGIITLCIAFLLGAIAMISPSTKIILMLLIFSWLLSIIATFIILKSTNLSFRYILSIVALEALIMGILFVWLYSFHKGPSSMPTTGEIASEIANKLSDKAKRAWITIENVDIIEPFHITERESYVSLAITIKNYGDIPASNIMIISQVAAIPIKDGLDLEAAIKKALQVSKNWEKFRHRVGQNLAPQNITTENHRFMILRSEINSAIHEGDDPHRVIFCLAGCIDYGYRGGEGQTTFNFALTEKDTGHMGIKISPRVIPINNLILQREPFGVYIK